VIYTHIIITIVTFSYIFISFKIEKRLPFSVKPFTFTSLFTCGFVNLGGFLYFLGHNIANIDLPIEFLFLRLSLLIAYPIRMVGYSLSIKTTKLSSEKINNKIHETVKKTKLLKIAYCFFLFSSARFLYTVLTGAGDRSQHDLEAVTSGFSILGFLVAFSNFISLSYILLPLLFAYSSKTKKLITILLAIFIIILNLLLGNRGPILYMYVFSMFGALIFRILDFNKIIKITIPILIISIFFIPILQHYRSTDGFLSSDSILDRFEVLLNYSSDFFQNLPPLELFLIDNGSSLYGSISDIIIFENTPFPFDYVGFDNFEAILYTFLPTTIFPNKPQIVDGFSIVKSYFGEGEFYGGFADVGFETDLYRRFSWLGILIGNFIFGIFYGLLVKTFVKQFDKRPNVFNFLKMLLFYTFYFPTSTVLTTFWIWLYQFPKYLAATYALYILFSIHKSSKLASTKAGTGLLGGDG
jgi:hypothetical protein